MIPADDRGLLLGDGLFETVLAERGRLVDWEAHVERLTRGCEVLGLPPPDAAQCRAAAEGALDEAGLAGARAAVRLTWTAGSGGRGLARPASLEPRLLAWAAPAPEAAGPAALHVAAIRRNSASPTSRLKTLSYLDNVLAQKEAAERGRDEAVMLNERGEIASAAAANLFWISEGRLFTPALECGVLDGIVRGRMLEAARALGVETLEVREPLAVLEGAEAVLLTNSLIRARPAGSIGGRALAPSRLGQRLAEAVRRERTATSAWPARSG